VCLKLDTRFEKLQGKKEKKNDPKKDLCPRKKRRKRMIRARVQCARHVTCLVSWMFRAPRSVLITFKSKSNSNPRRGFDSGFTYGCGGIEELDGTENDQERRKQRKNR
jgi:hypothetical protein